MSPTSGGIRAGRAFILIEAVDATGKILTAIGRKLKSWGRSLSMTGVSMAFQSFMAGTPMAMATKSFMDFDDAMRRVEARSEGTAVEIDNLRKKAQELSKTSALSATDIANLMSELAQMGFSRSQIDQMVDPINLLAQAGGTGNKALDAINAAKLVAGTIRSMPRQLAFEDSARIADLYAEALNLSNAALEDMATSMAYAAPIADQYGLKLEDVVAMMGVFRNLNIDAETAGTGFRNLLLELSESKGVGRFNELLGTLTGTTLNFRDAAGNLMSPIQALQAIGKALEPLGTAERGELLNTLFGKRVVIPATAFMAATDQFAQIRKALEDVSGAADRMRDIMEGGVGGAWRKIKNFTLQLAIAFGKALEPALMAVSSRGMELLDWISRWISDNAEMVNLVVASVAAWGLLGITLVAAGLTLIFLGSVFTVLGGILTGIIGLVTALVGGIGGLLATAPMLAVFGTLLGESLFDYFSRNPTDIFDGLKTQIVEFGDRLFGLSETARETIDAIGSAIASGQLELAFVVTVQGISNIWFQLIDALMDQWDDFVTYFESSMLAVKNAFQRLQFGMKAFIAASLHALEIWLIAQSPASLLDELGDGRSSDPTIQKLRDLRSSMMKDLNAEDTRLNKENDPDILNDAKVAREKADQLRNKAIEDSKARLQGAIDEIAYNKMIADAEALDRLAERMAENQRAMMPTVPDIEEQALTKSVGTPGIEEGLQRGSVEAAKAFYENQMRKDQDVQKGILDETKKHTDSLESIDQRLSEMQSLQQAMVGV